MLKASLAGIGGLSLPALLQARAEAAAASRPTASRKSVILLWMAGGVSHLDTWDPKPDRPSMNRGPFSVIPTRLPGTMLCELLPKQAAMMDRITIVRSVDALGSDHAPNKVFQTGNRAAAPRRNPEAELYPAIGSLVANKRGPNHPAMPPYVAFMRARSQLAFGGYLGERFDPFIANKATKLPVYSDDGVDTGKTTEADLFQLPGGLSYDRVRRRRTLMEDFDRMRTALDLSGSMEAFDFYQQNAVDMLVGERAQQAFDVSLESESVRQRYGEHLWCQQALIARRLVEAGVSFVTLDLSHHDFFGTWDHHGDNTVPYGGINTGLKPLLPIFDHLFTTLVSDLEDRGLDQEVLVLAMGEFGRTPQMGTGRHIGGRNHWPNVMSLLLAGGGLRHGQVIGASEQDGAEIKHRPVTPADLAATIYRHMDVPLNATYLDRRGRPRFIVEEGGEPIAELF